VSYADFVFVSMLYMFKRADQTLFDRLVGYDPVLKRVFDACGKWFERNDR
jgi:hypothetical protein